MVRPLPIKGEKKNETDIFTVRFARSAESQANGRHTNR